MAQPINQTLIREARPGERAAIRDLTLAAYAEYAATMADPAWDALHQVLLAALVSDDPADRIVADRDGELVGSVMLHPPESNAYGDALEGANWPELRLLAVAPHARGHGVGRALVAECVRRARLAGASALGLHSSESMRVAIHMYERMGFLRTPEHDFRVEGSELVMGYRLEFGR